MRTERHGYTFTTKLNTRGGIVSTILAVIALILLITGITLSYKKEGNAGAAVGLIGTFSFGFYLFSWIGSRSSAILWIAMCAIIMIGMMI